MSEMVERVAQAIYESSPKGLDKGWVDAPKWTKDEFRVEARAAIEAMSDPTHHMLHTHEAINYPTKFVELLWVSMIDAALRGYRDV